jgi:hypothetical protein
MKRSIAVLVVLVVAALGVVVLSTPEPAAQDYQQMKSISLGCCTARDVLLKRSMNALHSPDGALAEIEAGVRAVIGPCEWVEPAPGRRYFQCQGP